MPYPFFCSDCCQKLLVNEKKEFLVIKAALDKLYSYASGNSESKLQLKVGDFIGEEKVQSVNSYANIAITERIIDEYCNSQGDSKEWMSATARKVSKSKESLREDYVREGRHYLEWPTIIAARRWNSWTPVSPAGFKAISGRETSDREILGRRTGGGYLISDGKTNVAIDPGYGYLELLFDFHGITVCDIDAVIITHDHPDHSSELASILALRYVYKDECEPLVVFVNPSTFYLYERLCQYYFEVVEQGQAKESAAGEGIS